MMDIEELKNQINFYLLHNYNHYWAGGGARGVIKLLSTPSWLIGRH